MATKVEQVGFFQVNISLGSKLEVIAGDSKDGIRTRQYVTRNGPAKSLVEGVLQALIPAIENESDTIGLLIEDSKWIVGVASTGNVSNDSEAAMRAIALNTTSGTVKQATTSRKPTKKKTAAPKKARRKKGRG